MKEKQNITWKQEHSPPDELNLMNVFLVQEMLLQKRQKFMTDIAIHSIG